MKKLIRVITTGLAAATLFVLTPGLSMAQSPNYCYNHPGDQSHYCFCYHHPNQCDAAYRHHYPDWNRPPDWRAHPEAHRHDHPDWYNHG